MSLLEEVERSRSVSKTTEEVSAEPYASEDAESIDDDADDEEEEPVFKFQRLGASVGQILQGEGASILCAHDKFLALGTHAGTTHILDFNGNEVMVFNNHLHSVYDISIDLSGEYVASCSADGRVAINGLYNGEKIIQSFERPVTSIAVDPLFSKKSAHPFVSGGRAGQLVHSSKGWFTTKDSVIHKGEGPIHAIRWRGSFVAWANDTGVKVYDVEGQRRVAFVERHPTAPQADMYHCHIVWPADDKLIIGWAHSVRIGHIQQRNAASMIPTGTSTILSSGDTRPVYLMQLLCSFEAEYIVAGIAPFAEHLLVLACMEDSNDPEPSAQLPELRLVTQSNEQISSDALQVNRFEENRANDYGLVHFEVDDSYYIQSRFDVVVVRPTDIDDHVLWLVERNQFQRALETAQENCDNLHVLSAEEIGEKYVEHLIKEKKFKKAAEVLPSAAGKNKDTWEKWIREFITLGRSREVLPVLPVSTGKDNDSSLCLDSKIYEEILGIFLKSDPQSLYEAVSEWPHSVYDVDKVLHHGKQRMLELEQERENDGSDETDVENAKGLISSALARLYMYKGEYSKALHMFLALRKPEVFTFIVEHELFHEIQDRIWDLVLFNADKAIRLFADHHERIPVAEVVKVLQERDVHLLHKYLHQLFLTDKSAGSDFHGLQLKLYAEYAPEHLLHFLQQSHFYPLEDAHEICLERQLHAERVYLLGRMGNLKEALHVLFEEVGSVQEAIEFVVEHEDEELWSDLIQHSLQSGESVGELLEYISPTQVDPVNLIRQIPPKMKIPLLRDRLVRIISEYSLQLSLQNGCQRILKSDGLALAQRLRQLQCSGRRLEPQDVACSVCQGRVWTVATAGSQQRRAVLFHCGHVYHEACLEMEQQQQKKLGSSELHLRCPICRQKDKKNKRRR